MTVRDILERQAKERNTQLDADIEAVLGTAPGRRLFMGALAKTGVWGRTGCGDGDAVRLAYAAGRRDAGVELLAAANRSAAPLAAQAMNENNARVTRWNEEITEAKREEAERNRQ